jgi:hypothetical protein
MLAILTRNKALAWLLITAYFLALVFFHDAATVAADWIKLKLTLPWYNLSLLISGLFLSVFTGIILLRIALKHREHLILCLWFLITVALMSLAVFTLMVVNIEAIHFIQFGILSVLAFPVVRRFESAFVITTILGMVDEIYQYLVLNPYFKYFDFNDIVLNMIGAGAGLLILAVAGKPEIIRPARWRRSATFFFVLSIVASGIFISLEWAVSFFPVTTGQSVTVWFSIYRDNLPDQFWTYLYGKRYYHILSPWEGISLMAALAVFYSRIDHLYTKVLTIKDNY